MIVCDLCGKKGRSKEIRTVYVAITDGIDLKVAESIKKPLEFSLCEPVCLNEFHTRMNAVLHSFGKKEE